MRRNIAGLCQTCDMSTRKPELYGPPSEVETERLSLIRYQLSAAQDAAAAPPPISSLAINGIQDAVESTLALVGERARADVPARADFTKLFDTVAKALAEPPEIVGLRSAATALNNARVGFKHHGNQVRDETLRRHLDVAVTLIGELVQTAFDIGLEDVSMLVLVKDEQVRNLIAESEVQAGNGDILEALFRLRLAFDLALQEYESRKTLDGFHSIFDMKPSLFPTAFDFEKIVGRDGRRHLDNLVEWVNRLDKRLRLTTHGIDMQRYAYFDAVAPKAIYLASDSRTMSHVTFKAVTDEHFRSGYLFVLDTAIRLAARDYELVESRLNRPVRDRHFDPTYVPLRDRHIDPEH